LLKQAVILHTKIANLSKNYYGFRLTIYFEKKQIRPHNNRKFYDSEYDASEKIKKAWLKIRKTTILEKIC